MILDVKKRRNLVVPPPVIPVGHAAHESFISPCFFGEYYLFPPFLIAAWAAARRAIGTRNGEQLT